MPYLYEEEGDGELQGDLINHAAEARAVAKSAGGDTLPSDADNVVVSFCDGVARQQGGTYVTPIPGGAKGNSGQIGYGREPVNSDPQGFKYTDQPRSDRDGG